MNLLTLSKFGDRALAKAPYHEPVAEADNRTYVVEFAVPRDPLEREKLNMSGDIKLRGVSTWKVPV